MRWASEQTSLPRQEVSPCRPKLHWPGACPLLQSRARSWEKLLVTHLHRIPHKEAYGVSAPKTTKYPSLTCCQITKRISDEPNISYNDVEPHASTKTSWNSYPRCCRPCIEEHAIACKLSRSCDNRRYCIKEVVLSVQLQEKAGQTTCSAKDVLTSSAHVHRPSLGIGSSVVNAPSSYSQCTFRLNLAVPLKEPPYVELHHLFWGYIEVVLKHPCPGLYSSDCFKIVFFFLCLFALCPQSVLSSWTANIVTRCLV